jgi:carbon-monoxide dehydrogenase medium subunit
LKPGKFEYFRAESADAALELLAQYGDDAKVLAGGQSLVPMMNMRLARPEFLVDISQIKELSNLSVESDQITFGASVTQLTAERSAALSEALPITAEALAQLGHVPIRARGTVCGSMAHADSAAELPTLAVALDAEMLVRSKTGMRTVSASDFFRGHFTTALEPDELLTEVRIPRTTDGWGSAFLEVARRHGDFGLIAVAALVSVDGERRIRAARVAVSGAADVPFRSHAAEQALAGASSDDGAGDLLGALEIITTEIDPPSDVHASSEYRRELAGVLVRRALELAGARSIERGSTA